MMAVASSIEKHSYVMPGCASSRRRMFPGAVAALADVAEPRSITVTGDFAVRGGISSVIEASYEARPRSGKRAR